MASLAPAASAPLAGHFALSAEMNAEFAVGAPAKAWRTAR
jgi:hypothetical protein